MFFPRLRRQAKWAFALLIVVFGGGFIFLGVGSGGLDLGNLLRDSFGRGGSSGTSISKAQEEVAKHPRDAAGYKTLADAYERKGRLDEAIANWEQYVSLRPKDTDQLEHLGNLRADQAQRYFQDAQIAFFRQSEATAGSTFGSSPTSKFGQALGQDPVSSAVAAKASAAAQEASTRYQTAAGQTVGTFKKLVAAKPSEDNLLSLASTAERFGDTKSAVSTYERLLKSSKDPSTKKQIKAKLKTLQQPAAPTGGG